MIVKKLKKKTEKIKGSELITRAELNEVIQKMKQGKSLRHDEITPEMIKVINEEGKIEILELINKIKKEENSQRLADKNYSTKLQKSG